MDAARGGQARSTGTEYSLNRQLGTELQRILLETRRAARAFDFGSGSSFEGDTQ